MPTKKLTFNQLQDKWYDKLKKSGFEDLEYKNGSIRSCKPSTARQKDPSLRQATEEYYYMATHFLNDNKFENRLDQIIWEYHTNGISIRDIASTLNKTRRRHKFTKYAVEDVINRLVAQMKAKYLSP